MKSVRVVSSALFANATTAGASTGTGASAATSFVRPRFLGMQEVSRRAT